MAGVLIVVDGAPATETAVRAIAAGARREQAPDLHLLNVQPAFGAYMGRFLSGAAIRDYQREQGQGALAGVRRVLDDAGLPYVAHVRSGEAASTIAEVADELAVGEIVMTGDGTALLGGLARRLLVARVIRRAHVPVTVVKWPKPTRPLVTGRWHWLHPG